jgi:DNA-binding protein HU-beta
VTKHSKQKVFEIRLSGQVGNENPAFLQTIPGGDMTKDELVAKMAEASGVKKVDVQKALDAMIHTIIETIKGGDKVNITGLGIFKVKDKKARLARNPKTGESIQVPAKKAPKFIPSKNLKESVK